MTTDGSTSPIVAAEPSPPEGATAANVKSGKRKVTRKSVGTTVAAVTLAAVTVLSGPGLISGASSGLNAAGIIGSPPNSASSRIAGVHEDLARAVQLQQMTPEQAAFLENQLTKRIQSEA